MHLVPCPALSSCSGGARMRQVARTPRACGAAISTGLYDRPLVRRGSTCSTSSSCSSRPNGQHAGNRKHQGRLRPCPSTPSEPWTGEELQQLTQAVEEEDDLELGAQWREAFQDDVEGLVDYVERDFEACEALMEQMAGMSDAEMAHSGLNEINIQFSSGMVNAMIGMGTWRIREVLHPITSFAVQRIEGTWREAFAEDLNLYPAAEWKGKYEICDSEDPARELEGWSYSDVPCPEKGEKGYPRLLLENRCYCSRVFRKLHIEAAWRQDGLQVVHVAMYPRYAYDMPIFAMDLVMFNGAVTLAIVDACPVRSNLALPAHYLQTMKDLQEEFLGEGAGTARNIPDWGKNIFSPACVCVRPTTSQELISFLKYATALHRAHCMLSRLVQPLTGQLPGEKRRMDELLQGHRRFIDNQLANKKTSRVLEVAFGEEWTEGYMTQFMFDFKPHQEPHWEDSSMGQLFRYFDSNPEMGTIVEEMDEMQADVALERAEDVLNELASDKPVRKERVSWALQMLYDNDASFKRDCQMLMPELMETGGGPNNEVGTFLAANLEQLGLGGQEREQWQPEQAGTPVPAAKA